MMVSLWIAPSKELTSPSKRLTARHYIMAKFKASSKPLEQFI